MSDETEAAWELTRQLSPRGSVRIADVVVEGITTNDYPSSYLLEDEAPAAPWAMNLADAHGRYWYLCFDLDSGKGNAAYDAGRLSHWLDEINISHVVCVSGPSGGRHVWIALAEGADATRAGTIAHLAAQLLPSLDVSPLCNPATGCVRPPGAPHRSGGHSQPQGPVGPLLARNVDQEQLAALQAFLVDAGATIAPPPASLIKGMAHDSDGHPHLIGAKRAVSPRIRDLLNAAPADDTSRTQGAVLAGCARARWRFRDVLALLDVSPALEHARTRFTGHGRSPRSRLEAQKTLAVAWRLAVYFVAANPLEQDGADEEFLQRSEAVSVAVSRAQERADAMPGRWGLDGASRAQRVRQGRHSHRIVLDAVCLYLIQAARTCVEVDTRRLAADTGYGRESCRLALLALTTPDADHDPESSWLIRTTEATGVHGASYRLSKRFSTETPVPKWAQAVTRPSDIPGDSQRSWWINHLGTRLKALAHDSFSAPGSLGRNAGRIYSQVPGQGGATVMELGAAAGLTERQLRRGLKRLHWAGLVDRTARGWHRVGDSSAGLDHVAVQLGVDGYLVDRAARYVLERGVWAWWQAEQTWMQKPRKKRRRRRVPTGVALFTQNDRPDFPRYPRTHAGRPDHRSARDLVRAGVMSPTELTAEAIAA